MEGILSTSADTIRTLTVRPSRSPTPSPPSSPSLSASGSSVSSFPSVSSSFFFSSAAVSPPHGPADNTLIIPSLTLPAPLSFTRNPNVKQKQAVRGELTRLLVFGSPQTLLPLNLNVDGGADGPDQNAWVIEDGLRVLRFPVDDRYDSAANSHSESEPHTIELVSLGDADHIDPLAIASITRRILAPFHAVSALLAPPLLSAPHEDDLLIALLAGPQTPLYTALVVCAASDSSSGRPQTQSQSHADGESTPAKLTVAPSHPTSPPEHPLSLSSSLASSLLPGSPPAPPLAPTSASTSTPNPNPTPQPLPQTLLHAPPIHVPAALRALIPVLVLPPPPPPSSTPTPAPTSPLPRACARGTRAAKRTPRTHTPTPTLTPTPLRRTQTSSMQTRQGQEQTIASKTPCARRRCARCGARRPRGSWRGGARGVLAGIWGWMSRL
ncbi:hypothetical protein DFH09DRAFT_1288398 [Mycena vulgaris]|nr:hypothetical protein DFH09DRAFT_1288398 [Mycena vulgaris]